MFGYTFQWKQALARLPQMLDGALVTLQIALLSICLLYTSPSPPD